MARTAQLLKLSTDERSSLTTILRRATTPARVQTRARVLDLLHRGHHPNEIAATFGLSVPTIFNIKRRYLAEGLDAALIDKPRSGASPAGLTAQRERRLRLWLALPRLMVMRAGPYAY